MSEQLQRHSAGTEIRLSRPDNETPQTRVAQLSQDLGLSMLQPIHPRSNIHGHPSSSSLCDHCGGITPQLGTTPVYGTPLRTPITSGWNSETSSIFSVSRQFCRSSKWQHILMCSQNRRRKEQLMAHQAANILSVWSRD